MKHFQASSLLVYGRPMFLSSSFVSCTASALVILRGDLLLHGKESCKFDRNTGPACDRTRTEGDVFTSIHDDDLRPSRLGGLDAAKNALLPVRVSYEHRCLPPDILKALSDLWICIWG